MASAVSAARAQPGGERRAVSPRGHQVHHGDRAAHRRAAAHARVQPGASHHAHGPAHKHRVRAPRRGSDDRLFLRRRLIPHRQVLEPVAQRLGEVTRRHVLRRVLRRDHLEALRGPHRPEVRHLHQPLVQGRQQQVLRGLGQPVELVEEEDAALTHGAHQRPGDERVLPVPQPQHQGWVEPPGQAALREAVVAVHAHRLPVEVAADGQGHRGLPRSDRPLEQQMPPAGQCGERRRELPLATHDLAPLLDLPHRVHAPTLPQAWGPRPWQPE